jgi:type I restriction enzyme, S subunit
MLVWPIPLPPLPEQQRIVDEADRLESFSTNAKKTTSAQLARIQRLRQSVLKWAFEGILVEQDPGDEPSERLLARIRAERAAASPTKKSDGRRPRGAA